MLATAGAAVVCTGTVAAGAVPSTTTTTTTTPPSSTAVATPTTTSAAAAPTTTTATRTSTVPDLLTGINWIQAGYPSPCTDSSVQLVGGSAVQGSHRAVLDDVVALDPASGLAVAFLSCRDGAMSRTQTTAAVVRVRPPAVIESVAERNAAPRTGHRRRRTVVHGGIPGHRCVGRHPRRQTMRASATGFAVTDDEHVSPSPVALLTTPSIGSNAALVHRSVSPDALCYRWENVWLSGSRRARRRRSRRRSRAPSCRPSVSPSSTSPDAGSTRRER